jgi:hypothetical protein
MNEAFAKMLEEIPDLFPSDPIQFSGNQVDSGIAGEVNKGGGEKGWNKEENCKIVEDADESRIKAIGQGQKGDNRKGKENVKGIESGGKSTVVKQTDNEKNVKTGPVKPQPKTVEGDAEDKPMVFMPDDRVLMLNTIWPAMKTLLYRTNVTKRLDILRTLMAEAIVEHITKKRPEISVSEYRQMVSTLVSRSLVKE